MKKIRSFIQWFSYITTGILIVCTAQFAIAGSETLPGNTLLHILLSGFLTAAATTLFYPTEDVSKSRFVLGVTVHFISLCAIMVTFGMHFGWAPRNLSGAISMIISVTVVYALTVLFQAINHKQQAEAFNKALRQKFSPEDP